MGLLISKRFFLFVFSLFLISVSAYADSYEINLRQLNPPGAITHTRICPVDKIPCVEFAEIPIVIGESGTVLDFALAMKNDPTILGISVKVFNHDLFVFGKNNNPNSFKIDYDGLKPQKISLYARRNFISDFALKRTQDMHIADFEVSVNRLVDP